MDIAELGFRVDTRGLKDGTRELDKLEKAGARVEKSGGAIDRSMRTASGGMGAAGVAAGSLSRGLGSIGGLVASLGLATIGTQALSMARDFDASMNNVQAKLGATELAMGGLRDMAKDLGSTTAFSASEAADGMGYLAQAGLDTNEIMKAMPTTLNLASAANMSLAESADIATNVMGGFGLSVEELPRVADVLAATSSMANTSVQEMAGAMKRIGPVASSFGVSLEESAAAVGILANAGIKADEAGTGLAAMFTRLVNPVGEGEKAMKALGLSVQDFTRIGADGQIEFKGIANAIDVVRSSGADAKDMMRLFGQEAGPKLIALVNSGSDALRDLEDGIQSSGQAADMAATQMQGLPGALKNVASAWEGLNIAFMEAFGSDGLERALNLLTSGLRTLSTDGIQFLQNRILDVQIELRNFRTNLQFSDDIPFVALRAMGDALSAMAGYLAPLTPYLDDFAIALVSIVGSAVGVSLVAGALGAVAAVALSPVVLGVAALAAGAVAIRENWDGIAAWWSGLWGGLSPETKAALDQVVAIGEEAWAEIKGLFGGPELGESARGAMTGVVNAFAAAWGAVLSGINAIAPVIADAIDAAFGYIIDIAPEIAEAWDNVFPRLVTAVKDGFGLIATAVDAAWPLIEASFSTGWGVVAGLFNVGLAALRGDFKTMFEEIQNLVYGFVGNIGSGALKLVGAVGSIGWEVGKSLVGSISDAIETGQSLVGEAFARLLESIPVIGGRMAATVRGWMEEAGEEVAAGYADGMKSGEALVAASAESMGSLPAYIVRETMDIQSPSRVMMLIGEHVSKGFAVGITSALFEVARSAGMVSDAAIEAFDGTGEAVLAQMAIVEDGSIVMRSYAQSVETATAEIGDLTRGADENFVIMGNGGVVLERYRGLMESVGIVTYDAAESFGESGESAKELGKKLADAQADVVSLQTEQAILTLTMSDGAEAGETLRLMLQGYTPELAAARIEEEKRTEAMRDSYDASVRAQQHIESLLDTQRLQTIALTEGADAAEHARLMSEGYSAANAQLVIDTENAMEMQQEFHSALVRSISNADSIKDVFGDLGDFMKDWLKEKIAYFLANKITAYVTTAMGGAGSALGSLGGLLGGGGGGVDVSQGPLPGLGGGPMPGAAGATSAVTGLGTAISGLINPTSVAVVGVGLLVNEIGKMDGVGPVAASIRRAWEQREAIAASALDELTSVREGVASNLGLLGITISSAFADRMETEFLAAVADIDVGTSAEQVQAGIERLTRESYEEALNAVSPELRSYMENALDFATAPVEDIQGLFADLGAAAEQVLPALKLSGAALGDLAQDQILAAVLLSDALGGADRAAQLLAQFTADFVPAAEQYAVRMDQARAAVDTFNSSLSIYDAAMYGGADATVNTADELYSLYQSLDLTTESGADLAARILEVSGSFTALELEAEANRLAAEEQATTLRGVAEITDRLNLNFSDTGPAIQGAALALVDLAGGMDALQRTTQGYYDLVYSEEEQKNLQIGESVAAIAQWNAGLSDADLALAGVTDGTIDSAKELRDFVEAQDMSTESGRKAALEAMELHGAMGLLIEQEGSLEEVIAGMPPMFREQFGLMNEAASNSLAVLDKSFERMVIDAGEKGGDLNEALNAAFLDVVAKAGEHGGDYTQLMDAAFRDVLTEAGVFSGDLPEEMRPGFTALVSDAATAATDLEIVGGDVKGSLDGMGGAGDELATDMGTAAGALDRIADTLVDTFGDIGSGARSLIGTLDSLGNVIRGPVGRVGQAVYDLQAYGRRMTERFGTPGVDGSHSMGLDRVPFDGYIAKVHKDEMIVPADAAEIIRNLDSTEAPGQVAANAASFRSVPSAPRRDNSGAQMIAELRSLRTEVADLRRDRSADARTAEQQRGQITSGVQRTVAVTEKAAAETRRGYRQAALAAG